MQWGFDELLGLEQGQCQALAGNLKQQGRAKQRNQAHRSMSWPEELRKMERKLLLLFENGLYQDMEAAATDMLKEVESSRLSEKTKGYLLTRRGQAKYMQVKLN